MLPLQHNIEQQLRTDLIATTRPGPPHNTTTADMADSSGPAPGAVPGESPAQTKARLRRERLAAKSGASRLQQITALQGGPPKDISELEKDVPGTTSILPAFAQNTLRGILSIFRSMVRVGTDG